MVRTSTSLIRCLRINSDRGVTIHLTGSPDCNVVIVLESTINTQTSSSSTLCQQSIVDCVLNEFFGVLKGVQHGAEFTFNMKDLVILVNVLIQDILGRRVTTSQQVSDDSRQDELLDVSEAIWFTITRHLQEVKTTDFSERSLNISSILVLDISNNFLSNVIAVFPDSITTITESIASWAKDVNDSIGKRTNLVSYRRGRRGSEVVGNTKDISVLGRNSVAILINHGSIVDQITASGSDYVVHNLCQFVPCVDGLQQFVTNVVQTTRLGEISSTRDHAVVVTTVTDVSDDCFQDILFGIANTLVSSLITGLSIARDNEVRILRCHLTDSSF